jgi:hypothetical protein
MFVVPNFPHLRGIEMVVNYRELIESDVLPLPDPKWKQDPDIDSNQTFKPQPKYYINGNFVRQGEVPHTRVSTTPFPEKRVPRRELVEVLPGESDYEELCKKQGLFHLLPGYQAGSPNNQHQGVPVLGSEQTNGITPPNSDQSKSVNGGSPHHRGSSEAAYPNGIGESVGMPKEAIL